MSAAPIFALGTPPGDLRIRVAVEAAACWAAERLVGPLDGLVVVVEPRSDGAFTIATCRPTRAQRRRQGLRTVFGGALIVVDLGGGDRYSVPLRVGLLAAGGDA